MHASHNHSAPEPLARLRRRRPAGHPRLRAVRGRPRRPRSPAPSTPRGGGSSPRASARRSRPRRGVAATGSERERPVDDSVTVIRVDRADGDPLAAVVSFAAHPITVGGVTREWDAEYIAPLREAVEARVPGVECLFLQGCAGDVAPFDWWFGNAEASRARLRGARPARPRGSPRRRSRLYHRHRDDRRRRASPRPRSGSSCAGAATPTTPTSSAPRLAAQSGEPEPDWPEVWAPERAHDDLGADVPATYQAERARACTSTCSSAPTSPRRTEIQAIAVGDAAIVTNPFELFNGAGRADQGGAARSRRRSPRRTRTTTLATCRRAPTSTSSTACRCAEILDQDEYRWAYGITNYERRPRRGRPPRRRERRAAAARARLTGPRAGRASPRSPARRLRGSSR